MSHDHHTGHHHHHAPEGGTKLLWVTLLNVFITVAEFVGGVLSGSLSLLSDAVHNLGDTLSVAFAWFAGRVGARKASMRYTFGYKRAEILAAFLNAALLIAICLFLLKEAWERWHSPEEIDGSLMLWVAVVGLLANLFSVLILQKEKDHNINTRAAYLHLLGDTLSSVAVILGALAIMWGGVYWVDPLITVLVSIYIIVHTWHVLKEASDILMQSAPEGVDIPSVIDQIEALPGVDNVHHLHLWQLNESQIHFEAHITVSHCASMREMEEIRSAIRRVLDKYRIGHSTLQMETEGCAECDKLIVDESR